MLIKMKTTAAGPDGIYAADKQYVVPDGLAQAWIDGGYAERVEKTKTLARKTPPAPEEEKEEAAPAVETAVDEPEENAADPPPKRRRRKK